MNPQAYGETFHGKDVKRVRENKIERYLCKQVKLHGGRAKKLTGTINDPDRLILWPARDARWVSIGGGDVWVGGSPPRAHFVETKATGKTARAGQLREHKRLRDMGFEVRVLNSIEAIDAYIKREAA